VVVLGGQLAKVGSIITSPMRASLERCAIPSAAASLVVRLGELDTDADVVGALVSAGSLLPASEGVLAPIVVTS
jgi:hypothetical protein